MKKYTLYLLLLFGSLAAKAQFTVAVVVGPQATSVSPAFVLHPDTVAKNAMNRSGLNIGFIANLPVTTNNKRSLFFRTGIIYSQKGSKAQQLFDTSKVDMVNHKSLLLANTDLRVSYIDAPFNLLYKLPLKGKTKFILGGGLQASLFYNGNTQFGTLKVYKLHEDSSVNYEYKETSNNDVLVGNGEARYKVVHFSANALAGFEFGRVFLTANYSQGLTGFYHADGQSYRHTTMGVTLGIFLGKSPWNTPVKKQSKPVIKSPHKTTTQAKAKTTTKPLPATPQLPAVKDTDGDGVPDEQDLCPELGGTIATNGCPDRDGDGIPDKDDQCPEVAGVKKYNGCPIPDSDKDGINDEEDKCPNDPGPKENNGCPKITKAQAEKIAYAARQIQFEFKKADLSASSFQVLDEVVAILKTNPGLSLRIEGHTSGANSENNMKLSQLRAESVRNYFIYKGIDASRITAIGYGSTRPLAPTDSQKENPKDRRVELITY
jgi:outer membrane protein OmpA-like peptidoglycan-associated protein